MDFPITPSLPTFKGVENASRSIRTYLPMTPLVKSGILSQMLEAEVWLKYEIVTPISSFKIRGAINAVSYAKKKDITGVVKGYAPPFFKFIINGSYVNPLSFDK